MMLYLDLLAVVLAFSGAALAGHGHPKLGIGLFIACFGYLESRFIIVWRGLRAQVPQKPAAPISAINGLPLPAHLLDLVRAGRWKSPTDLARVDRAFPPEPGGRFDVTLYRLECMPFANSHWVKEADTMWLGAPDDDRPPGDIDPKRSVLVGDLGIGFDQPIALDFRMSMDAPRVLTLHFMGIGQVRWIEVAPNIETFTELIGL